MLQNYTRYRILQEFFDSPRKSFQIREISRIVKLAHPSVIKHLQVLEKMGFILKEKKGVYPAFKANRDSEDFKLLKKQNIVWRIHQCGLLGLLEEKFLPDCIVLFGSCARGEDNEESDIDLFVQAKEEDIKFEKFEKLLKRKINILFEPKLKNLSKELLNNIINGQVVYGYLKVL